MVLTREPNRISRWKSVQSISVTVRNLECSNFYAGIPNLFPTNTAMFSRKGSCRPSTLLAVVAVCGIGAVGQLNQPQWTVVSADGTLSVTLGLTGTPRSLTVSNGTATTLASSGASLGFSGATIELAGPGTSAVPLAGGGVMFVHHVRFGQHAATVVQRFTPERVRRCCARSSPC